MTAHSDGPRRVYLECTQTFLRGGNSGIQRVVRNIVRHGRDDSGGPFECVPVIWAGVGFVPVHAVRARPTLRFRALLLLEQIAFAMVRLLRRCLPRRRGRSGPATPDGVVRSADAPRPLEAGRSRIDLYGRVRARLLGLLTAPVAVLLRRHIRLGSGDTLFLCDASWERSDARKAIERAQRAGARVIILLYDLLPLQLEHPYYAPMRTTFLPWLHWATTVADGAIAISRASGRDLAEFAAKHRPADRGHLPVESFRLGAELDLAAAGAADARTVRGHSVEKTGPPSFLMVGTVEPRKNHDLVLDVFEKLWAEGGEAQLWVVGRQRWEPTVQRIDTHPELGHRLIAFSDLDDGELALCYRRSRATICASSGEGFGLPIVESLMHGCPVIASDLDVHREVGGECCQYFGLDDTETLRAAIAAEIPVPEGYRWPTWAESWVELRKCLERLIGSGASRSGTSETGEPPSREPDRAGGGDPVVSRGEAPRQ